MQRTQVDLVAPGGFEPPTKGIHGVNIERDAELSEMQKLDLIPSATNSSRQPLTGVLLILGNSLRLSQIFPVLRANYFLLHRH